MCVEEGLEARPEQHGGCVDVGVQEGDFAALQEEGEVLCEAHAEEDAQGVVLRFRAREAFG